MEDALELVMTPARGAAGIRVRLIKRITSIGSAPDADLRFHSLPAQWATVHHEGAARGPVTMQLADGGSHRLAPGQRVVVDGVTVELGNGGPPGLAEPAVDELAARLAGVDGPDDALAAILDGVIAATGADLGAIILRDPHPGRESAWTVARARDAAGAPVEAAAELLGDVCVRDVLATGERVLVPDVAQSRYARSAALATLELEAVLCLPLRREGRTLGAMVVGARERRATFSERAAADLHLLTALVVPFLAQLRARARTASPATGLELLIGESPAIEQLIKLVRRIGPTDSSVLVVGAPGTGKELVARAIHDASVRAAQPLIVAHCAETPAALLEATLFGYRERPGLIEDASGSTLFLDEVGELPLGLQEALLRVLEERTVRRLDTDVSRPRAVDVRLIAASARDLVAEVAAGRFREELLLRLQELRVDVPLLRDRGDDVLLLARAFLRQAEAQLGLSAHGIGADAIDLLLRYPWPGNVRELKSTMRRAAIVAEGSTVRADDLQLVAPPRPPTPPGGTPVPRLATPPVGTPVPPSPRPPELGDTSRSLADARDDYVRRYVAAVLERCGGNREAAARELDIGVRTLYRYLGQ